MMKAARGEMDIVNSLPIAQYAANSNGSGVSKVGFYGLLAVIIMGTIIDGTHVFKLQESDDNVTFNDVAVKNLEGAFSSVNNTKSNTIQRIAYMGQKKYVRAVVTVTGATTGGTYSASFVRCFPGSRPVK